MTISLRNILSTDEAHFTLRRSVKSHKCRIWATENPRTVVEIPLRDEKVTVWVEFNISIVIGPFFFEEMRDSGFITATVTSERYADMLQNRIIPSLADKHLQEGTVFMQDGAAPHIARRVKDLLRGSFGDNRVIQTPLFPSLASQVPRSQSVRLLALELPEVASVS